VDWDLQRAATVTAAAVAATVLIALLVHVLVLRGWRRDPTLRGLAVRGRHPFWLFTLVVALLLVRPELGADPDTVDRVRHVLTLLAIAAGAWLFARAALVAQQTALRRYDLSVKDNLRVRRLHTQVIVIRRVAVAVVFLAAFAGMLMTFESVRTLGASLLASAGILGAVAGLAAQTTLANVIAGMQLAFSDEIRIDDVVVVEDEWGWVEELTLTYVVVHLWDERRLVLPTTYFTQKPFQNWTRHEARVLGSVLLHVDYRLPVEPVREELRRILEDSPLWDRRDWVLQVVDTTPTTIVLRALMSSADAPTSWDLRCEVREKLVAFLAREYPHQLPRLRTELDPAPVPLDGRRSGPDPGR
jgi:small-conductance mechanosensitive channel